MADRDNGQIDYLKEAFHWQYNKIMLFGALAFAGVSLSALPLIVGAGLELMYLATVPNNNRFQRLVRSWKFEDEKRSREKSLSALFYELPAEMRARYANLDNTSRSIRENYRRLTATSQMFVDQMENKLEGLTQSYVRLLNAAFHHQEYLRVINPAVIHKESDQLQKDLEHEPPKVQEINRKRIEILAKRLEKYDKIKENCQVIDAQCSAVEDVLNLIRDQSVTMHDPEQIAAHLDGLVKDVEQTEETVREVESIFEISPLADAQFDPSGSGRNRVSN
jgi:hypothetical protein